MPYGPPFSISPRILSLSNAISHILGELEGEKLDTQPLKLRKDNNIRTIHASLAIEGNTLSLAQVTDIVLGKRVVGLQQDIVEVKNALAVYEQFDKLNAVSMKDFLRAHRQLMNELIDDAGQWRSGSVGVFKGNAVTHVAPQSKRVPGLMKDLFDFLKNDKETPWILKSCVFHYELEFIHPFMDGNGRMGRLWQQVVLCRESDIFKVLTVEELIRASQAEYYRVLQDCDKRGDSTLFVEYSMEQILVALQKYREATRSPIFNSQSRLNYAKKILGSESFTRKNYLNVFKDISTATASRDLGFGVQTNILERFGEANQSKYRFH